MIPTNVLKTGLNRPVEPVGPETGEENGSAITGFMSISQPDQIGRFLQKFG